jgi:hypothetical protein
VFALFVAISMGLKFCKEIDFNGIVDASFDNGLVGYHTKLNNFAKDMKEEVASMLDLFLALFEPIMQEPLISIFIYLLIIKDYYC